MLYSNTRAKVWTDGVLKNDEQHGLHKGRGGTYIRNKFSIVDELLKLFDESEKKQSADDEQT